MEFFISFLKKPFTKRLIFLVIFAFVLYLVKKQLTLFLLTFIIIYLINTAQKFINSRVLGKIKINKIIVIISIYLFFIAILFLLIYKFLPELIREITDIVKSIKSYDFTPKTDNVLLNYLYSYYRQLDLQKYIVNSGSMFVSLVSSIGAISVNIVMAVILSFFFLLEKEKIKLFFEGFKNSKLSLVYDEMTYFGEKFTNSFGKVIQTQILISSVNSVLSFIILAVLKFPNAFGLCILIFILGLVPVAGVIISFVPLSIIAYSIGGFQYVVYVIITIVILHTLEAYILNPKLMSRKTKLPVFVTFLILIMSEFIFGIWGLIVGIPITIFLLDVLDVKTE